MKIKVLLLSAVSVLLVSSAGVAKEKCSNSSDWTVGPIIGGWVATCNANNTQLNCALDNGIMNVVNAGGLGPQACSTTISFSRYMRPYDSRMPRNNPSGSTISRKPGRR